MVIAAVAIVGVALAVVWRFRGGPISATRPNVILISIDTLRPDHLGSYGYAAPTSPSIDRFRADAVLFSRAYSAAPATLMSHATLLTSLIPQHHGASYHGVAGLSDEALTLADVFKAEQYSTLAVVAGGQMDAAFGLDQGFDTYETEVTFPATIDRALRLLDSRSSDPFFLFLHTYDVHMPYRSTPEDIAAIDPGYQGALPELSIAQVEEINKGTRPLPPDYRQQLITSYDAGIRKMDRAFGRLLQELRNRNLYDDTLIVLVSDHGNNHAHKAKPFPLSERLRSIGYQGYVTVHQAFEGVMPVTEATRKSAEYLRPSIA